MLQALDSSWISGGPFVDRLENDLGRFLDAPGVVTTSNGTTALQLAFLGAGLRAGDEVVVPGFGFMAAANVALHMGARPVFADVDPDSWCLTAATVERVLSPRTRLIVPVHTYGNVCALDPLLALAADRRVTLIEDAAESFGSRYRGRASGTLGDLGTFSFHATKTVTTGEGGAVCARDPEVLRKMGLYRNHGMGPRRYFHEVAGHNFRLTNLQAAIGCAQLASLETIKAARARVWAGYQARLAGVPGVKFQAITPQVEPIVWAVAVELTPGAFRCGRDELMQGMAEDGIETRPGFYPASAMPHLYAAGATPVSDRVAAAVVSLPSYPTLADAELDAVVESLRRHAR